MGGKYDKWVAYIKNASRSASEASGQVVPGACYCLEEQNEVDGR